MAQITFYADDELAEAMKQAAAAEGVSVSKWIAALVRERTRDTWPEDVLKLAGAWPDFPAAKALRAGQAKDARRGKL
jgi:hypothetical protein